ncbi:hypothetical protein BDF19DRAFT_443269, partial [Syncephalis fuscata]
FFKYCFAAVAILLSVTSDIVVSNELETPNLFEYFYLLAISQELISRDHHVYYATFEEQLKWAAPQPDINLINIGPTEEFNDYMGSHMALNMLLYQNYEKYYNIFHNIISGKSGNEGQWICTLYQSLQLTDTVPFTIQPYSGESPYIEKSLILVPLIIGFDQPRPTRPNVVYIGPFLDVRERTIFIGFGSIGIITPARFEVMVQSLSAAYQAGYIDESLPPVVYTNHTDGLSKSTSHEHRIEDMLNSKHPFIRVLGKAPQRAVLKHTAVKLFISHCGSASVNEAMEAGTPIIAIPIFELHKNTRRVQKMAKLYNRRLPYVADMIEMAAIPGALKYLETADQRMSWWRTNNIDVWTWIINLFWHNLRLPQDNSAA